MSEYPDDKYGNNPSTFYAVELVEDVPQLNVEPDHERVWLTPEQTIVNLKNEGYAWAIVLWMRAAMKDG